MLIDVPLSPKTGLPIVPDEIKQRVRDGESITIRIIGAGSGFAKNAQKHGVAGINVDGCRVPTDEVGKPRQPKDRKDRENWRITGGTNGDGATSPQGRWPANVITDGSEEVLAGFPETTSGAMKQDTEAYEGESATGFLRGRSGPGNQHGDSGSAARFFYCAKASGTDRGNLPSEELPLFGESVPEFRNTHPTVKPLALMEYLVKLVTMPERNLILDLFAGSGTTLVACKWLGIPCIGIELNEEYAAIAANRLRQQVLAF